MTVKARITAIKGTTESIVARESAKRVHVDIDSGAGVTVEVIVRADGRTSIEVKQGRTVRQFLNLMSNGDTLGVGGTVIDGKAQ